MSRQYGTGIYATSSTNPGQHYPLTMAGWVYPDNGSDSFNVLGVSTTAASGATMLQIWNGGWGLGARTWDGTVSDAYQTSVPATTWTHVGGVFASASSRIAYVNGSGGTENTTTRSPASPNEVSIASFYTSSRSTSSQNVRIAEAGIWTAALTPAEMAMLAAGVSPLLVRPAALWGYWPEYGNESAAVARVGPQLSFTGSPSETAHCRVFLPRRPWVADPAAGATSAALTGAAATAAAGAFALSHTNPLAGSSASASAGAFVPALAAALLGGQSTVASGSISPSLARLLSGAEIAASAGTATPAISAALASALATVAAGDLTGYATQLGRPISDISAGGWTPSVGLDLYATIDEITADDGDYDYSANDPSADVFEVRLTSLTDPASSSGHVIRYRLSGEGGGVNFTVSLRQGAGTQIAVWTHNGVTSVTGYEQTLSGAEADAITDYTDLRLRFSATKA